MQYQIICMSICHAMGVIFYYKVDILYDVGVHIILYVSYTTHTHTTYTQYVMPLVVSLHRVG